MGCDAANALVNCGASIPAVTPQPFFEAALAGTGYCTGFSSCTAAVVKNESNNFSNQAVWSLWSDLDNGGISGGPGGSTLPGWKFPRSMLNSPIYSNCGAGTGFGCSGQMSGGVGLNASIGYGNYNAGFVSYRTTDWHGITSQQNLTWSRALGTGAEVQATSEFTADDPFNFSTMYGVQPFNQNLVYNLYIAYSPSVFKGQNGFLGRVLGGWSFAPIFVAGTGTPIECNTLTGDSQEYGAGDGNNFFDNANCIFTTPSPTARAHVSTNVDGSHSVNMFANPVAVASTVHGPILGIDNKDGGTGAINAMNYWNIDFQVKKDIKLNERFGLEAQFMFLNIFNHTDYASPTADPLDMTYGETTSFGDVSSEANTPRQIEFGIRLNF
jgi:hypothetical protein